MLVYKPSTNTHQNTLKESLILLPSENVSMSWRLLLFCSRLTATLLLARGLELLTTNPRVAKLVSARLASILNLCRVRIVSSLELSCTITHHFCRSIFVRTFQGWPCIFFYAGWLTLFGSHSSSLSTVILSHGDFTCQPKFLRFLLFGIAACVLMTMQRCWVAHHLAERLYCT